MLVAPDQGGLGAPGSQGGNAAANPNARFSFERMAPHQQDEVMKKRANVNSYQAELEAQVAEKARVKAEAKRKQDVR